MWFTIAVISWVILATVFYLWRFIIHDIFDLPKTQLLSKAEQNDKSISLAELGLRDAVRRVAREAARLPCLAGTATGSELETTGRDADHTYEDLLATAILNKVIDSFQKDNYDPSMPLPPLHGNSSRHSTKSHTYKYDQEFYLDDNNTRKSSHRRSSFQYYSNPKESHILDDDHMSLYSEPPIARHSEDEYRRNGNSNGTRRRRFVNRNVEGETGSMSSLEDFSMESNTSPQSDNFAFVIKQSIEEITSSDVDDPTFEVQYETKLSHSQNKTTEAESPLSPPSESWEENWLFQKKKTKTAVISTPVTMLVPKSSTDYRALIGDRDAEDTTDLSDVGSDYDEPGKEIARSESITKSFITTPRTIIGGKSPSPILPPKEFRTDDGYEIIEQHMKISDEDDSLEGETANRELNEIVEPYEAFKMDDKKSTVKNKVEKWDNFYESDLVGKRVRSELVIETGDGSENFESLKTENSVDSLAEAKNSTLLTDSQYSESDSLESNTPKDLGERSTGSGGEIKIQDPVDSIKKNGQIKYNYDSGIDTNDPPPQKGTIAEREHKKWENAIEMPNNPYTPENIQKRLKGRSNSIISLPQVTSLQRRNSYRREIDPNEIEDTCSIKSVESVASSTNTRKQNAVWKMFEDIVHDYADKPELNNNEVKATKTEDKWEMKYKKQFVNNNYLNGDNMMMNKAQSCMSLIESEKKDGLQVEYPERSLSTSPGGVYLKDAYTLDDDNVKRFGRDYYIKEAKRACGSRKFQSPIPSSVESLAEPQPMDSIKPVINEVYQATPAISIGIHNGIEDCLAKSPDSNTDLVSLDESMSSFGSTDLQRVYNFNTGTIIYQLKSPTTDIIRNEIIKPTAVPIITTRAELPKMESPASIQTNVSHTVETLPMDLVNDQVVIESIEDESYSGPPICQSRSDNALDILLDECTQSSVPVPPPSQFITELKLDSMIKDNVEFIKGESGDSAKIESNHQDGGVVEEAFPSFENNEIIIMERMSQNNLGKSMENVDTLSSTQKNVSEPIEKCEEIDAVDDETTFIPSVKERMKRFLNPKMMESYTNGTVDEKFHPHHSLTARSLFRRANSSQSTLLPPTTEVVVTTSTEQVAEENITSNTITAPVKSLRERREFFEQLSKNAPL